MLQALSRARFNLPTAQVKRGFAGAKTSANEIGRERGTKRPGKRAGKKFLALEFAAFLIPCSAERRVGEGTLFALQFSDAASSPVRAPLPARRKSFFILVR